MDNSVGLDFGFYVQRTRRTAPPGSQGPGSAGRIPAGTVKGYLARRGRVPSCFRGAVVTGGVAMIGLWLWLFFLQVLVPGGVRGPKRPRPRVYPQITNRTFIRQYLGAHNRLRSRVDPPASDMLYVVGGNGRGWGGSVVEGQGRWWERTSRANVRGEGASKKMKRSPIPSVRPPARPPSSAAFFCTE